MMRNQFKGLVWASGLLVGFGLSGAVAMAQSGSLEPPTSAVNGSGDPVATTQTQPSWDQSLRADNGDANGCNSTRFKCVLPTSLAPTGAAVLDKETGLVWERSPGTSTTSWSGARSICVGNPRGNRWGWRLPSVQELASLAVQTGTVVVGPFPGPRGGLPVGHPFSNVQLSSYWTATASATNPAFAWVVTFGGIFPGSGSGSKTDPFSVWCVRGGGPLTEY